MTKNSKIVGFFKNQHSIFMHLSSKTKNGASIRAYDSRAEPERTCNILQDVISLWIELGVAEICKWFGYLRKVR